jgi:hypothetical protein
MAVYRTKFLDYDARREPKTDRYCVRCQKDIKQGSVCRSVHIVDGGAMVLHPADEHLYTSNSGDCGSYLIGPDCASILGIEWTRA